MTAIEIIFWLGFLLVFYTYVGYGIVMYIILKLKRPARESYDPDFLPPVTLIIPAFNEADYILQKVENSKSLDYPEGRLKIIVITDGSNDGTYEKVKDVPGITALHVPERGGKSGAMNRAMQYVDTDYVIFCDANTILNKEAVKEIIKHYKNPKIGAVACEKRIIQDEKSNASSAGEGMYWKYESFLKQCDSDLLTIVGAAGELMSCRRELYQHLEPDTLLDDFMLTMRIADKGYKVVYEPNAYAMETASASVKEELKRKVRICAGGWQSIMRLKHLLIPFKRPLLSFIFISHRVLRWTVTPVVMFLLLPVNVLLAMNGSLFYTALLVCQLLFYIAALSGWYLENRKIKFKPFFIPYYFFIMNYSVIAGFMRYIRGKQSVKWERAKRA